MRRACTWHALPDQTACGLGSCRVRRVLRLRAPSPCGDFALPGSVAVESHRGLTWRKPPAGWRPRARRPGSGRGQSRWRCRSRARGSRRCDRSAFLACAHGVVPLDTVGSVDRPDAVRARSCRLRRTRTMRAACTPSAINLRAACGGAECGAATGCVGLFCCKAAPGAACLSRVLPWVRSVPATVLPCRPRPFWPCRS